MSETLHFRTAHNNDARIHNRSDHEIVMELDPVSARLFAPSLSNVNDAARRSAAAFALFAIKELAIALAFGAAAGGLSWAVIEWVL